MEMKVDPDKIKTLRVARSWSQEKLAEEASVSLRTVQRMEVDGSASLKSRLAVAEALAVEPSELDPGQEERQQADEQLPADSGQRSAWQSLKRFFAYPGPTAFSGKIRAAILVFFWLGMVVTGGLLLVIGFPLAIAAMTNPDSQAGLLFVATIPLFVVFLVTAGIYFLFKKLTIASPGQGS